MERFGGWRQAWRDLECATITVPAWRLAPKIEVPAKVLLRDENDHLGRFFLGLAAVFNDIKGLVLFEQYLLAMDRPARGEWSARAGQWRGLHIQIHRWLAGVLYELMEYVAHKRNKGAVNDPTFRGLVASLPDERQRAWKELEASSTEETRDARGLYACIRDYASFHYGPTHLVDGFVKQFENEASDPAKATEANRSAQYSYGDTMRETRFYYADAALQQILKIEGVRRGDDEIDRTIVLKASSVNDCLGPLILAFINSRVDQTASRVKGHEAREE